MNFSDDPWQVLELDRALAGEREVKRAYARLLKQHRPDSDPDGFRRVNQAYQAALQELSRSTPQDGEPMEPGLNDTKPDQPAAPEALDETTPEPPARPVDPAVLASFEEIRANLMKRLAMAGNRGEFPEFIRLRNLVRNHPKLAEPWTKLMLLLVEGPMLGQVLNHLHAEDLWLLMREGQGPFAAGVMAHWRENPTLVGRLTHLGTYLLELTGARDRPGRLQAMHFTARMAAFYQPAVSAQLADELFQQTEPGVREDLVREIEMRSAAGKLFALFGLKQKRFWEQQLFERDGEAPVNWQQPEEQTALRDVAANCPPDWEGWPLVTQIVPENVLRPVLAQNQRRASRPVFQTQLAPDRPWYVPTGRVWFILAFMLLKFIFLTLTSKPDYSSSSRGNSNPEEVRRRLDDLKRTKPSEAAEAQRRLDKILHKNRPAAPFKPTLQGDETQDPGSAYPSYPQLPKAAPATEPSLRY